MRRMFATRNSSSLLALAAAAVTSLAGCERNRDRRATPTPAAPSAVPSAGTAVSGEERMAAAAAPGDEPGAAAAMSRGAAEAGAAASSAPPVPGGAAASADPAAPGMSASAGSCALAAEPLRLPAAKRLVAIGDIHGDLRALQAALRTAGAIDAIGRWRGGGMVVVQTGDLLDRGDDEQAILDYLEVLEGEARQAGGALHWLLGNHELMNAAGDLRYVTRGGFADFEDVPVLDAAALPRGAAEAPAPVQRRLSAFAVGAKPGPYARVLSGQSTVRIVGDTVFSHAGVVPAWAGRLEQLNLQNRCWLAGELPSLAAPAALTEDESPVWTRAWGFDPADCARLASVLEELGVKRMVVGHTVQPEGITSSCDGALWRIDVGLGAHYGGPIQVLELSGGVAKVLKGERAK